MKIKGFAALAALVSYVTHVAPASASTVDFIYGDSYTVEDDYPIYSTANGTDPEFVNITGNGNTIISGNGAEGFQFIGTKSDPIKTTITISGIKEMNNFIAQPDGNSGTFEGGAAIKLVYGGTLNFEGYSETNRIIFRNDVASSDGHSSGGGAMFITGGGQVSDLYADFYNNKLIQKPTVGTSLQYARGGALSVGNWNTGSTSTATTEVGNIFGRFEGNQSEYAGAIYVGPGGKVGNIGGWFDANIAQASFKDGSPTGGCAGGAIRIHSGIVGDISASFTGNIAHALSGFASGGAIAFNNTSFESDKFTGTNVGYISSDFTGNISFSNDDSGYGGAVAFLNQVAKSTVHIADSTITGNIAGTALDDSSRAQGGALFFQNSANIYISALEDDMILQDNITVWGAKLEDGKVTGGESDFNAIYADNSTIHLNAQGAHKVQIDDSIKGTGTNTLNVSVDESSTLKYGVYLNDDIENFTVNMVKGSIKLGSSDHGGKGNTQAGFTNSSLNIKSAATLNTKADYISSAKSITNEGKLELEGGTLSQSINSSASLSGHIFVNAATTVTGNTGMYADAVSVNADLMLSANTTTNAKTLIYSGVDMYEINGGEQIVMNQSATLDFDTILLDIETATLGSYFDLIVGDDSGYISYSDEYTIKFTLGGVLLDESKGEYVVETLADGGLRVHFISSDNAIPEPNTATLSLLALTALLARRRRKGLR